MKLFGYTIAIYKDTNSASIRRDILTRAEQNAIKGLEAAKLELAVKQMMQTRQDQHKRTDAEKTGIANAIKQEQSSISNWQTQLDVINSIK